MISLEKQFEDFQERISEFRQEVEKVFVGQSELVEQALLCLLCRGHVLIEGLPGLGKTLLVKTLSEALDLRFSRIQCTPDLMPADIVGTNLLIENSRGGHAIRFHRGPIFSNIILADEVNRATPKTQSAFLEAMQERKVTALGETYELEEPFLVMATQNPIEMEGTYPLPEAQLDRFFFKSTIEFPSLDDLSRIVDLTTAPTSAPIRPVCNGESLIEMSRLVPQIEIAERAKRYVLRLVRATHPEQRQAPSSIREYVKYGASPRAAQSLILGAKARAICNGRYNVSFEDIHAVALPSLRHRLILGFEAEVQRITSEDLIRDLLAEIEP